MAGSDQSKPPCLLCGHAQSQVVQHLTGLELRECSACSFQFFDPSLAGGEAFYQQLDDPDYYTSDRPEFERTVEFARANGLRRVLDIGCGRGDFLDLAKKAGLETYGLELNRDAAAMARSKGHQIFSRLLHELDHAQTGGFDLLTLFQVLEHVPQPAVLMKQAASF